MATLKDPGLPRDGSTRPYWQIPLHFLSNTASATLPDRNDVVIIGSGMTGCSVAKSLLQNDSNMKVTVLEARGLASGASSRNGGHIVSPSFADFKYLVGALGVEAARDVAEFTLRNIDKTFELVDELGGDLAAYSKIRRTTKIIAYTDPEKFAEAQENLILWNQHAPPHRRYLFNFIDSKEAARQFGLQNVAGAAVGPGAAVWPYRLWTGVWTSLQERFGDRLSIETFTPATSILHDMIDGKDSYTITTPRGKITAPTVVHCTNGYTSHLLPSLRGRIFPLRGTMSAQDTGPSVANNGHDRSWSFVSTSAEDATTGVRSASLYYLTQDPDSGLMLLGGEHDKPEVILSADDTTTNPTSRAKITDILPRYFVSCAPKPEVKSLWSGIMGFTRDALPLVGRIPRGISGRAGAGEWIAAGFNGYGTGYCLSCGQAVAEIILGRDVSGWVPSALSLTQERFEGSLRSANAWEGLVGTAPPCDNPDTRDEEDLAAKLQR